LQFSSSSRWRPPYGALHYMTALPGNRGALPAPPEEAALAASLKRHIATIAAREHNVAHMTTEKVAHYIEATLASLGYAVGRQEFLADGNPSRFFPGGYHAK
jgi:hypothetical protein